ncbi:uracil/xanthine transporter [Idiomarina sp. WRN-38]|uniref:Uracil permease n=1 Tax=Vreelandella aquamarina TaxID=77097 RepID=A0A0D7V3U3_9GAMM|nr:MULTISPECIES: uracil-xanthine permease family protein [Halomonas]KTG25520.1 uracil/xanthine transporter [Idiomarina sp. H105]MED5557746.1 uracil-xanthine permease family protein [Pseudomonadota bacterium]OAE96146.1 uracil/xanthine transporter [Idiomarina sp. WRN-38]HAV46019.1 uracil-xanthine permease [Halomonas sp.]KJD20362.1 uracil transporter [Halomonas meridiana]
MTNSAGQESWPKMLLTGAQMLFVAFGALVLVPLLTGLDPSVALFTAGIGTLVFHSVTKQTVPVFLASSFAFIAPIQGSIASFGVSATLGGLMAAGLVYVAISQAVRLKGTAWLHRLLPAVVVGPVIMVIGLALAPVAVSMATGETSDNISYGQAIFLSMASLLVTLLLAVFGRGLLRLVPIMGGIATGYALALIMGVVDFTPVREAAWLSIPNFTAPSFHWAAILFMIPVAIAPAVEHIGDMVAIGSVTRKNYLEKPGLHRTLLGDGLATTAAALFGGPPNTTYSEVTGAVTLTKAFNPKYMIVAAVIAIILAFVGKLGALLQTIPGPVMGGIMTLLFGSIAVVGMNTLVRAGQSLTAARNLVVVSLILVFGIGGMQFGGGQFTLQGVSLAALVGIALNWLLPAEKEDE